MSEPTFGEAVTLMRMKPTSICWAGEGSEVVLKANFDGTVEVLCDGQLRKVDPAASAWLFVALMALAERSGAKSPGDHSETDA